MAKKLRLNQRSGYVFEAYATASSDVESLKRMAEKMTDPGKEQSLSTLARRSYNERAQAYERIKRLDDILGQLQDTELEARQRKELWRQRDTLVGEIFIRLYHISLAMDTAKKIVF